MSDLKFIRVKDDIYREDQVKRIVTDIHDNDPDETPEYDLIVYYIDVGQWNDERFTIYSYPNRDALQIAVDYIAENLNIKGA